MLSLGTFQNAVLSLSPRTTLVFVFPLCNNGVNISIVYSGYNLGLLRTQLAFCILSLNMITVPPGTGEYVGRQGSLIDQP